MRRRYVLLATGAVCIVVAVLAAIGLAGGGYPSPPGLQRGSVSMQGDVYPYAVYVPATRHAGSPSALVVVLHGCTMTADQMAAAAGFDAIAQRERFAVLYPDVDPGDATNTRCWKAIWEPSAEGRGRGDAAAIAAMTRGVIARWGVDPRRVYAIGISAGGFETPMLAAAYPDLYAAIGIHSGAAYDGGQIGCLGPSSPSDTVTMARRALAAMGPRARVMPVIIVHGDSDPQVPYRCGQQALAQWLSTDEMIQRRRRRKLLVHSPSITRATVPGGHAYTVASYSDGAGCLTAQLWTVHGMGHFWSGGSSAAASARFSDPAGPSAAQAAWTFFSDWTLGGPARPCQKEGRGGGIAAAAR